MRNVAVFFLALTFTLIGQPQQVSAADESWVTDPSIPAVYALGNCRTDTELDCVESVEYAKRGEGFVAGVFKGITKAREYSESNGNFDKIFNSEWQVGEDTYQIETLLETQSHRLGGTQQGAALRVSAYMKGYLDNPDPLNRKIRIKVRTSWLRPMNVQLKANESDFKDEIISGGHRWTLEGYATQISDYTGIYSDYSAEKLAFIAQADVDTPLLVFYIHHADTDMTKGYWPPVCADKGYTVQSHNTNATGDPIWNAATDSLEFSIMAPHTKADGTPNIGFFKLWASEKFLDCKYPTNTLTKSARLSVQILYEDGTVTAISTAVTRENGYISFSANGFHFSSPKVILKAEVPAPTPTPTPTATPSATASASPTASATPTTVAQKKITITCVKGKVTKKVTAVKPVCPKGYKKK